MTKNLVSDALDLRNHTYDFHLWFTCVKGILEFLDSECKCWTLDAGLSMLVAGLWTLESGHWTLEAGHWRLHFGRWALVTVVNWFRTESELSF